MGQGAATAGCSPRRTWSPRRQIELLTDRSTARIIERLPLLQRLFSVCSVVSVANHGAFLWRRPLRSLESLAARQTHVGPWVCGGLPVSLRRRPAPAGPWQADEHTDPCPPRARLPRSSQAEWLARPTAPAPRRLRYRPGRLLRAL